MESGYGQTERLVRFILPTELSVHSVKIFGQTLEGRQKEDELPALRELTDK